VRYQGEIEEPSITEAREWLAVARTIFDAVYFALAPGNAP